MVRYRGLTRYYFAVWKQEWSTAFYIFAYLFGKFFSVAAAAAVAPTFAAAAPAAAAARAPAPAPASAAVVGRGPLIDENVY